MGGDVAIGGPLEKLLRIAGKVELEGDDAAARDEEVTGSGSGCDSKCSVSRGSRSSSSVRVLVTSTAAMTGGAGVDGVTTAFAVGLAAAALGLV